MLEILIKKVEQFKKEKYEELREIGQTIFTDKF
jgi:hypothetical protein